MFRGEIIKLCEQGPQDIIGERALVADAGRELEEHHPVAVVTPTEAFGAARVLSCFLSLFPLCFPIGKVFLACFMVQGIPLILSQIFKKEHTPFFLLSQLIDPIFRYTKYGFQFFSDQIKSVSIFLLPV